LWEHTQVCVVVIIAVDGIVGEVETAINATDIGIITN
jgi:hypothetical protein